MNNRETISVTVSSSLKELCLFLLGEKDEKIVELITFMNSEYGSEISTVGTKGELTQRILDNGSHGDLWEAMNEVLTYDNDLKAVVNA